VKKRETVQRYGNPLKRFCKIRTKVERKIASTDAAIASTSQLGSKPQTAVRRYLASRSRRFYQVLANL
jgi:hypothetical protein